MQNENNKNEKKDNLLESDIISDHTYPVIDDVDDDITFVESTEDGEVLSTKDIVKKLREDLKTCRKEKEEYLTGWQRSKADYVNLQRELSKSSIDISILAKEKMVKKLIPAIDSFEIAFVNEEHWKTLNKEWQLGIRSIYQQLIKGFNEAGINQINQIEIPFDPNIHESINIVETEDESKNHLVEKIFQTGYKVEERTIRPAKVTIYEYKK